MTKAEFMPKPTVRRGRLVDALKLSASAAHLVIEAGNAPFAFEPGQYVALSLDAGAETIERHYSIASAPNGSNHFELCVREPPGKPGMLARLESMKQPDSLAVWGPAGVLALRQPPRDSLFIATGTGIAPMRSMLQTLYGDDEIAAELRSTLLFGARAPEDLYYADEFRAMEQAHPGFRFCPTLTCAPQQWEGCRGRVQTHLADCLEERGGDVDVYVCGHVEMVEDVRKYLAAAGLEEDAVIYEQHG
jgi:CDP-4-dehydro-6-deoxyglucose reductase